MHHRRQRGQVLVIVAVWLLALIGSAALILLTGSVEWQRNQVQQLADQAALDAAQRIGVGCSLASASAVITEADNFVATQRPRTGSLTIGASTCAAGYAGTDTFATNTSETIHYPYRSNQQQVEVILTVSLPISFGNYLGASNTNVTRRAVAMQLAGSTNAITAGTLSCTGGQFNVGGSILASNAIALAGGCAVYAHDRFDAASGTYSNLGNVSVWANAQTWVGAGGVCAAAANSGSTNAVCADGYERNGHSSLVCGTTGTSAYLAAGDALQNGNPCAAGKAPQYVPPVATLLPPEPDADPAAIATLPGGTACTPAGLYTTPVVAGVTVGTARAGTPAPVKDASGFWHLKPSCYSYLDLTTVKGGGIANRQNGTEIKGGRHFITPTLPGNSLLGSLLVVTLTADPNWKSTAAPVGWVLATGTLEPSSGRAEIWYNANAPVTSSATFTVLPASSNVAAQMTEWTGAATVAPLDQTGATNVSAATTTTMNAAAGATTQGNELVITDEGYKLAAGTFTPGAAWNSLVNDPTNDMSSEYRLDLGVGVPSETVTTTSATTWALAIATFKVGGAGGGAVLDPGFYYFNGSGLAGGGGGICLNGGQLLARDVTLEFVNQAGFSSGSCAVGGTTLCGVSSCAFGSTPCSISACPPNAPVDSAGGGYTWFAAPCSSAPAGDASCPGSAWCPVGDRACWNLLLWAPAGVTGQVAIKGASAQHWLLGSVFWAGTCTDAANGASRIDGNVYCGTLSVSASAGAGIAIGSDYGISTALVEAVLLE